MTDAVSPSRPAASNGGNRRRKVRPNQIRSRIVEYLAHNGASKVADISSALGFSRDVVRYHLTALENASIVRSNLSPGMRARFTPFYSLIPADARRVRLLPTT
ncbi:hypothetical protein GCM10009589_21550 [Arthrobacter pascens]|nr:ArsR family transcriptional regulator [Arthrobacter pascens]